MKHRPFLVVVLLLPAAAHAEPTAADSARAASLFERGHALMAAGKLEEACDTLAESDRLDPALGTHLNLAYCHEAQGRAASAWSEFGEAAEQAAHLGDKAREGFARQHRQNLEERLSRLRIRVQDPPPPGMQLTVDGKSVDEAFMHPIPVDPGPHTVEANSPGQATWRQSVNVPAGPSTLDVIIPSKSAPPPKASVAAPPESRQPAPRSTPAQPLRVASYALGAAALVGVGVGTYFGIQARSKNDESFTNGNCDATGCNADGKQARNDALTDATISTVAFAAGGAALAGAVVLFVISSSGTAAATSSVRAAPLVARSGGGISLLGSF